MRKELLGKPLEVAITVVDTQTKRFTCSQKAASHNRAVRDLK